MSEMAMDNIGAASDGEPQTEPAVEAANLQLKAILCDVLGLDAAGRCLDVGWC
jgi:hypothetical protein